MGVEAVTTISDLNASWPLAGDERSTADDHIRNIKTACRSLLATANLTNLAQIGFPATASGQGSKYVRVNAGATALEYVALTAGTELLPSQGGNNGKLLGTNGTTASWQTSPALALRAEYSGWQHTLTLDNTWRDLDLSAIVPSGARAVLVNAYVQTPGTGTTSANLFVRPKGWVDANAYQGGMTVTSYSTATPVEAQFIVGLDANRVIQYKAVGNAGGLTVRGWFF